MAVTAYKAERVADGIRITKTVKGELCPETATLSPQRAKQFAFDICRAKLGHRSITIAVSEFENFTWSGSSKEAAIFAGELHAAACRKWGDAA